MGSLNSVIVKLSYSGDVCGVWSRTLGSPNSVNIICVSGSLNSWYFRMVLLWGCLWSLVFATRQLYRLFWNHMGITTIQIWCLGKFNHISVLHSFVWNEDIARFYYICCIFLDIGYIYNCKAHFREGNFSYESLELSNLSKKLDYSSLGIILYSQQLVTALISISL